MVLGYCVMWGDHEGFSIAGSPLNLAWNKLHDSARTLVLFGGESAVRESSRFCKKGGGHLEAGDGNQHEREESNQEEEVQQPLHFVSLPFI